MDPYNPYSPPAVSVDTVGFETMRLAYRPAQGMGTKWMYLAICIAQFVVGITIGFGGVAPFDPWLALIRLGLVGAWLAVVCVWISTAWSEIPNSDSEGIGPGRAVAGLFIPLYNLYWMFTVSSALCDVLNKRLARIGSRAVAPKSLCALCGILQIAVYFVPYATLLPISSPFIAMASSGLWFAYMYQCDKARTILARNTYEERTNE